MKSRKTKSTKEETKTEKTDLEQLREELRKEYASKGPLRLRKFATAVLGIKPEIVDKWNDFDFMVSYCVAKKMGDELPVEPEEDTYEEPTKEETTNEEDEDMFDGEMEGDDGDMFGGTDDDDDKDSDTAEDPEPDPTPEPKKAVVSKKRGRGKSKVKSEVQDTETSNDIEVQLQGLLDVITNQGVALDNLKKLVTSQTSTLNSVYARQDAAHQALSVIAKTCFSMSTYISQFVPRALKAMKFKVDVSKIIKSKADESSKIAEGVIQDLLDTEAD